MRQLSDFLGVRFDARLLAPYEDPQRRMTQGARPGSRSIGDPRFHTHQAIDPATITTWAERFDEATLSPLTVGLASKFGYGRGPTPRQFEGWERLSEMVRGWKGVRTEPDALVVGRNIEGRRRPLFWCLQSERELSQLATHLGSDRPVYGLRSAHNALVQTPENLLSLARLYSRQIRAVDPEGPYVLGGNCQGAGIAFDIAGELSRDGKNVALLFVMEAFIERPCKIPISLLYGAKSSGHNPYLFHPSPQQVWQRYYSKYVVDLLLARHGQYFRSPTIEVLAATLNRRMDEAESGRHWALA